MLAATVAGCAGAVIREEAADLVGKPLGAAIAKLGMPTDERQIAGQKVYIWARSRLVEGTTSACQLRVIMRGDVIGSFDLDGTNGACMTYARALQR